MNTTHGDKRRRTILEAALALWADDPASVTVRAVARGAGLTHGAVLYHFGTVDALKADAAALAVLTGNSRVIVQLIGTRHPAVTDMDSETRHAHMTRAGF